MSVPSPNPSRRRPLYVEPVTRYCSNHRAVAPVEGGAWKAANRTRRWICSTCREAIAKRLEELFRVAP